MNRIRKIDNIYQVLMTPNIPISPDSSIMVGNWDDENLRNYYIVNFDNLNDAQCESLKYPDIDWHRLIVNHEFIYKRLKTNIKNLLDRYGFTIQFDSKLMGAGEFKNAIFDRVLNHGERFNLRYSFTDIISFVIINPWSDILHKISKALETEREHLYRDDLRIRQKKIVDGKIICLYGYTEFGTIYEIKLVPTILYQWGQWIKKQTNINGGFTKQLENTEKIYKRLLKIQEVVDSGPTLI